MKRFIVLSTIFTVNLVFHTLFAYNLKQIADKEYMSNSAITSLCQDERGVMWIGTCDGLNVYAGQKIEEYKTPHSEQFLSGNLIDNILYTGNDTYWIQTYHGLNRLDRRSNTITQYTEFQKLFFMDKDNQGNLYIINDNNCIYYYHKKEQLFKKINTTGIPISDIVSFFTDKNNRLWVVMKGYCRCYDICQDKQSGDITLLPRKTTLQYQNSLLYCFHDEEKMYYIDTDSNFYVYQIDSQKSEFIKNLKDVISTRGKISSIVQYHNQYFISFLMNGILLLEKDKHNTYQLQSLPIHCGVFCLKKDRFQDIVWIGTDGQGIFLYSTPLYSIKSTVLNHHSEKIERPVRALFMDQEQTFWVGTKGNGILKIYQYAFDKNLADCHTELVTTQNSALGSDAVYCFAQSHRNLFWIGDEEGLNYYSYHDKRIRKIPLHVDGQPFKYIHDIYETGDSVLWLASVGMGILKVRIAGTHDEPILKEAERFVINEGEMDSNYFFSIFAEDDSHLLFGNKGYGVFRFNPATRGLEPFSTHKYENVTMNNILAINKDSNGHYLFGTSFGLIQYTSDSAYQLYNAQDGFLNNTIHDILKEDSHTFWLSTNLGLINYDSQRNVFRSYGFGDGLEVVEFSDGAAYYDKKSATLFFGGINGFVSIRADGCHEQLYMPPIYFDRISIFGEQYNRGEFLTKENDKEILHLKYDQNFFSLFFASVDYLNGNNCTYYYKLKGLSDQWVNNGPESTFSFTNMTPGEYTLLVKYYNSVFDKESQVYSLIIRVAPPWYASWWAYLLYFLIALLLAALGIRSLILRSQRKKQAMLNELEKQHQKNVFESKLQFFTNIAHEFCTPLTLIYGPCGRILASGGLNKFVTDYVQMIQANAERLNHLIHELIEFRRIETGNRELRIETLDISSIIKDLTHTFIEMARSRNITFLSKIPAQLTWNSDKGFLNTIVINLISNAFKYTPEGKSIKICLEINDNDQLIIRVANEGSYIKEEDFQHIFNRYTILDNFENPADNNLSRNGLGLAISYHMAQLLKGTLKVENTPDGWVLFTLSLPSMKVTDGLESIKQQSAAYIPQIDVQIPIQFPHHDFDKMKPTLLIIDDEIEMCWFISEIFENDFNVVHLQHPEHIDPIMDEVFPNVIICDIRMPGISGIELTRKIKSNKETVHIPIIIVSSRHEMQDQIEALSAGAEIYITKPFHAEHLRISVQQVMERKEVLKNYFSSPISSFEKTEGRLTHKESKKFLQSVLKIINDHITDKELTPRFIAEQLAISPRSLYRKMEEIGSDSPTNLIKDCRLHIAKNLLMKTKKTIDEIVFESGFSNKVTFFKAFKEQNKCTPKEFRMKYLKDIHSQ